MDEVVAGVDRRATDAHNDMVISSFFAWSGEEWRFFQCIMTKHQMKMGLMAFF